MRAANTKSPRTNRTPCISCWSAWPAARPGASPGTRSRAYMASANAEAPTARPKPTVPPKAAMSTPVMEGPIMRPACQGTEPSAMAFGSRSRPTIWGTRAMRLGSSNARKVLLSTARARSHSTRRTPAAASANAASSAVVVRVWVTSSRRRRLTRSASTPPHSWNTTSGMPWARPR